MSTPNPGTTPWVPMWNLNGGMDLRYQGAWAAGNYYDGDVVVYQGVTYICVRPTNKAPTPWAPGNLVVQPSVRVYRNATQSIPNTTMTAIQWTTVRQDYGPAAHWNINTPTRLTCQVAGTYLVWGEVQWAGVAGGTIRGSWPYLNGSIYIGAGGPQGSTQIASGNPIANSPTLIYLNVGDYVELLCYQDSGGAMNVNASDGGTSRHSCEFGMALLGGMQGPPGLAANVNYGTTLPPSPADGQEAILVDSITNPSYQWRFRYNAGSTSAYKWEFTGGASARLANGSISTTSTTPVVLTGIQTFTVPRSGEYTVPFGCLIQSMAISGAYNCNAQIFASGSAVGYIATFITPGVSQQFNGAAVSSIGYPALTAGQVLDMRVWGNAANNTAYQNPWYTVTPMRVA